MKLSRRLGVKTILPVLIVAVLTGCGSGISGAYGGGEDCLYDKFVFKSGGTAYVTVFGMEQGGHYKIDGDKITLTMPNGQGIVFTKKGDTLEATVLGQKMQCKKL